jgi:nucleosome binding factor SPN SPT16 subunit
VFAVKDPTEILNVKKAALLGAKVMKDFVVPKLESIIDEGKSVRHQKLQELTEEAITDPSKVCTFLL